ITLIMIVSIAVLSFSGTASGHTSSPPDRAGELLERAREAIGIGSSRSKIEALIVAGEFTSIGTARRSQTSPQKPKAGSTLLQMVPADDVGNFRFALQVPDKFRQDFTYWTPNGQPSWIRTLCR